MQKNVAELLKLISGYAYHGRLGKLFKTNNSYYVLDTGTGKVASVDKCTRDVLSCILECENPEISLQTLPDIAE